MPCILCNNENSPLFYEDDRRYFKCNNCDLIFVDPQQLLSREEEKERYGLHHNSPEDPNYRNFLNRLFIPLKEILSQDSKGLDFGSGPGPTLSVMFEEAGNSMTIYDPFFANNPETLKQTYDFITATEVLEHLHKPLKELSLMWNCLVPGGILGIMTLLASEEKPFPGWHYKNDPTHVCFYSKETFEWLSKQWNAKLTIKDKGVILLQKPKYL